jgi:hypothetical protein
MTRKRVYGEGSVFRRCAGRGVVSVPGSDGKRITWYVKNEKEGEKVRRQLLQALENGTLRNIRQQPLKTHLKEWLETKKRDFKPNTYINARYHIENRIIPAIGHISLQKLTTLHIQRFY